MNIKSLCFDRGFFLSYNGAMKRILSLSIITALGVTMTTAPVKAEKGWASFIGPIIGVPVGAVSGLIRGALTKSTSYSDSFSEALGGNSVSKLVGIPTGLVTGTVTGGVTGLFKGVLDGVVLGIEEPLSAESGSLKGDLLDYEPYDMFAFGEEEHQVQ